MSKTSTVAILASLITERKTAASCLTKAYTKGNQAHIAYFTAELARIDAAIAPLTR